MTEFTTKKKKETKQHLSFQDDYCHLEDVYCQSAKKKKKKREREGKKRGEPR